MAILNNIFVGLSKNKLANFLAKKYGLKFGASRFVAGKNIKEALETANQLNSEGIFTAFNYLGEFSDDKKNCNETTTKLIEIVKNIKQQKGKGYLSIKASSIGLQIDKDFCRENLEKILEETQDSEVFIRMEMEEYALCDKTIEVYKELSQKYKNFGTVLQAYLYRTNEDLDNLESYHPNLRLVKGAYNESENVAFPDKSEVDENYLKLIKKQLSNKNYASIATHDPKIINETKALIKEYNVSNEDYEFQMLYGIRPDLEQELARDGFNIRVYLPFGDEWFGYFMRRLGERPENVTFVLKNTLKRKKTVS